MPGQPPGWVFRSPCPSGASKGTSLVASPVTADHECPPPLTSRLPRRSPPINRPTGHHPRPSPTSRPPPGVTTPGQLVNRPTGEVLPAALTSRLPPFPRSPVRHRWPAGEPLPPSSPAPSPLANWRVPCPSSPVSGSTGVSRSPRPSPLAPAPAAHRPPTGERLPALTSRRHHRSTGQLPCPGPLAPRACPRRSSPANWRVPASPQLPSAPARHPWSTGQPLSFFPLSPLPPAPGQPGSTGEPPTPPGHLAVAPRMSARPTGEDPTALRAAGTDAGSPPPGYLAGALPPLHRALGTPADWPGSPTRARRPSLAARPRSIHQLAGFLRHGRRPGVIAPVAHTTRPPLQAPGAAEPVMGEVFLTNLAKVGLTLSDS